MPTYTSPEAGDIDAPDGHTAAAWLLHRLAHQLYGERAIVRARQIWPLDYDADHWTASGYLGAPRPGDGRLDYIGIYVYRLDDLVLGAVY
jgi:hypothetical protein